MMNIVVNESINDDNELVRAAFEAAEILRRQYSIMVFVEINTVDLGYNIFHEPYISVGSKHIVPGALTDHNYLVTTIVRAVIENVADGSVEEGGLPAAELEYPIIAA